MKVGVCSHFAKLSNALLYSLGYKVLYIHGHVMKNNIFDENPMHAWSLIKVEDKWYPFDSNWGIVSGKLPVSHIFSHFINRIYILTGKNNIQLIKKKLEKKVIGKFIS